MHFEYNKACMALHAGEPELAVAPFCLQRPISVFQPVQSKLRCISQYGLESYSNVIAINLLYSGRAHYDLLV